MTKNKRCGRGNHAYTGSFAKVATVTMAVVLASDGTRSGRRMFDCAAAAAFVPWPTLTPPSREPVVRVNRSRPCSQCYRRDGRLRRRRRDDDFALLLDDRRGVSFLVSDRSAGWGATSIRLRTPWKKSALSCSNDDHNERGGPAEEREENTDDGKIDNVSGDKAQPRATWRVNLRDGALHVHENFLDLLVPAYKRSLRAAIAVCIGMGVTYRLNPELGCRFVNALRTSLLSLDVVALPMQAMASALSFALILAASVPLLAALMAAILVPGFLRACLRGLAEAIPDAMPLGMLAKGMDGVCLRIGTFVAALGTALRRKAEGMQAADRSGIILDTFLEEPIMFPLSAFVVGPLVEEFISRGIIQSALKRMMFGRSLSYRDGHRRKDENGVAADKEGKPVGALLFGHPPCILLSSILFSMAHCANWTGPLRTMGQDDIRPGQREALGTAAFLITMAMSQMAASLYLSLRVYGPQFERGGVWASVGAHAAWNISLFFTVPFRIVVKGWDLLQERARKGGQWLRSNR